MKAISKQDASLQGLPRYFTGTPCKHGHISERYINCSTCVTCAVSKATKRYELKAEEIKKYAKERYDKNPDKFRKQATDWAHANPEKKKVGRKADYWKNRDRYIKSAAEWCNKNPEKTRESGRNWAKNHPAEARSIVVERRARKLQRTPLWLSFNDRKEMIKVYTESRRLTDETGVKHHVDHIVPLQGKNVSGLHVPQNLQILTAYENISKGNRFNN